MSEPLIDIRPDHWAIVADILRRHVPDREVWAFGSRATWNAKGYSDLDLAVIGETPLSLSVSAALADDFAKSDLPFKVDVVDWATTSESFRKIIERDKVVVQRAAKQPVDIVAGEWRTATVSELQRNGILLVEDGNHGEYRPRPDEFVVRGVAFIRAADMDAGRVLFESAAKINERARARVTKGIGAPGDVLLSHKGTVGKVALVPDEAPAFVCSPQTTFWRTRDEKRLDRKYLYAFLRWSGFRAQLATRAGETDMAPYVSLTSQRGLSVVLPPIDEQRAIAHILGTLDDKIELNRRMNETLEAMARALFKSWFVDFDPVRAKQAKNVGWVSPSGRNPPDKTDGGLRDYAANPPYELPPHIADLFPNRLADSELGEIPERWEVKTVGDLAEVVGGSTPSTKELAYWDNGCHHWATPKDLSALTVPALLDTERRVTDAGLAQISSGLLAAGTVLLSSRAPIGYLAVSEIPVAINQGFIAMQPKKDVSNLFLLFWASFAHDEILRRANGSTFLEISKANFRPISVIAPPAKVMKAFDQQVRRLYERIVESERESRALATLRDTLLPKLISGELRVATAENLIGKAV